MSALGASWDLVARTPTRAIAAAVSALVCYVVLTVGGPSQGMALIVFGVLGALGILVWSERRSRTHTATISQARDRLRGLTMAHEEAVRNEQRFRALVLNASETISILSEDFVVTYSSPSVERLWGYPAAGLLNMDFFSLVHPQDAPQLRTFLNQLAQTPGGHRRLEFRLLHEDGSWRYIEAVASNLIANREVGGVVLNSRDATERKELENKLTHQAFHDPLTGLPNRSLFMDRLKQALSGTHRHEGRTAVVSVDVDNFKGINDTLGHAVGDEILVAVSRALSATARPHDTVARLGGDEFAMLLPGVHDEHEAVTIGERLIGAFETPIRIRDHDVRVSLSIGVGLSGSTNRTSSELLRRADIALYEAKRQGRGRCIAFDQRLDSVWVERVDLENSMRGAADRGEFANYYQPLVDLNTGDIVGVEALVRWNHPERGLIGPADFVPLAEETGEITKIGQLVLDQACLDARSWQQIRSSGFVISVNVSARQLERPGFARDVAGAIERSGLPPSMLQLEITESMLVERSQLTMQRLGELRRLGVRIAIDDFGTGYSSLSYLAHLPVDALKLDRSFVSSLGRDERTDSIVRAIMMLAHGLAIDVVAEGIETRQQQDLLRRYGYSRGQGFLYAPPLTKEDAARALDTGNLAPQPAYAAA